MKNNSYSTQKIENAIAYKFTPIQESVTKYCNGF